MAEEKIVLEVGVNAEQGIRSLKDLKSAIKAAQDEVIRGTPGAEKKLADLKDRFEDISDSTKALKGGGIEPLRGSFNLFFEGLTNFDFGKIGTAFKGLGAAIKAVPIFLLVEGITYLITNFKELSEGTGIVAKVLKPIGDLFTWITDKIYAFTDAIGLTNSELDKMGEAVKTNADKAKEALGQQTAEYDRQIAVAKAAGKSTVELEQAKQQAIIDTNVAIVKQIEAFVRAGGVLDEEKQKLLTASLDAIKNAKVQEYVIEETAEKAKADLYKKSYDEKIKKLKEEEEERKKILAQQYQDDADYYTNLYKLGVEYAQKRIDYQTQLDKTLQDLEAKKAADLKAAKETELANENAFIMADLQSKQEMSFNQQITALQAERDLKLQNTQLTEEQRIGIIQEYDQKEGDLKKKRNEQNLALTAQGIAAAQNLTNMFFDGQIKAAKGNAEKEKELKRKQFNLNKAFNITTAIINGVQAVQGALATQPAYVGIALAVLNGITAAANVAKIASAKFDEGGASGSSGDVNSAIQGSVGGASAPTIASPNNTVTQIDDKGMINKAKEEEKPQKVYVTESDITEKQKRVSLMENAATL